MLKDLTAEVLRYKVVQGNEVVFHPTKRDMGEYMQVLGNSLWGSVLACSDSNAGKK